MKNQVLSIAQMRHLRDLGVDTSRASMCWLHMNLLDEKFVLTVNDQYARDADVELIPAFTLQDIINMLPEEVPCRYARYPLGKACLELGKDYAGYSYTDMNDEHDYEVYFGGHEDILVEVYNLLCWCAENGYLNNNQTK